mgnify:CR=1 FL=1
MKFTKSRLNKLIQICILSLICVIEGHAVEPDEILDDQYLELRARDLSKQLRCLVCRNESIDESNSMIAKDLRAVLRERLLEGDSDREVMSFLVNRYGEYILLKPKLDKKNIILWFLGPGLFIVSLLALIFSFKRKRNFYVRNNKSS